MSSVDTPSTLSQPDQPQLQLQSDQPSDRSCKSCHESWEMQPDFKEVKRGVVDTLTFCLAKPCRQVLPDGEYPRLASLARGNKKLCGGKLWIPIQLPMTIEAAEIAARLRSPESRSPATPATSFAVASARISATDPNTSNKPKSAGYRRAERDGDEFGTAEASTKARKPYKINQQS